MKSNALRKSAKGQDCTFNIAGICNYNPETVVLCHLPYESHGTAHKGSDLAAGFGCSSCHDVVDGRVKCQEYTDNAWFYNSRAIVRTLTRQFEMGLLVIKGAKQ